MPVEKPHSRAGSLPQLDRGKAEETGRLSDRLALDLDLDLDLDLKRPVNHAGRTQALRSGHPGMDAGIAALGQGRPSRRAHGAMPE